MSIDIHVAGDLHLHFDAPPDPRINEVLARLKAISKQEREIMADLTPITDALARLVSEEHDTGVALRDLAQQVRDNATDPQAVLDIANAITGVADEMQSDQDAVADVTTPPEEPPAEPPAEEPPAEPPAEG